VTVPQGSGPPPDEDARPALGQAFEFRIWSELIHQSRGHLHVFLPLLDRGIDAIVHRLDDGAYIPVQLKARSKIEKRPRIHFVVKAASLVDDRALLIAGLLGETGLGPYVLVVDEGTFKQLADRFDEPGRSGYVLAVPMSITGHSRWVPYLVPIADLASRLLAYDNVSGTEWPETWVETPAPVEPLNEWLGFLGEQEIVRRLAQWPGLDLFRPFPDLEIVEVLARNHATGRFVGLQVKAATWDSTHPEADAMVRIRTLRPTPSTFIVVLAWMPGEERFHDQCVLIPSQRLSEVAIPHGDKFEIKFRPDSHRHGRLDPYRLPLQELPGTIESLTAELRAAGKA
jgi:hypothetical protein